LIEITLSAFSSQVDIRKKHPFNDNCYDVPDSDAEQGTRMELHCAIARYQVENADEALDEAGLLVPAGFALPSTAQYMTCAGTKITVDSVRWPVSRLSVPGSLSAGGRNFRSPMSAFASDEGDDGSVEVDAVICRMIYNADDWQLQGREASRPCAAPQKIRTKGGARTT
jgi:hypothetical protein